MADYLWPCPRHRVIISARCCGTKCCGKNRTARVSAVFSMLETQAVGVHTDCGEPHLTPVACVLGANCRAGPALSGRAFWPDTEVCQYLDGAPGQTCVV